MHDDFKLNMRKEEEKAGIFDSELESERVEYIDDAERGISDDWAHFDDEKSMEALFKVWLVLNGKKQDLGFDSQYNDRLLIASERIAQAKEIIREVIYSAARRHAEQVMRNR